MWLKLIWDLWGNWAERTLANTPTIVTGDAPVWQWYGYPRVLSIPIPKILAIWASPGTLTLTLTLTQIAKVIWEGDAHITRVLGMGMPISLSHRSAIGQFFSLSPVTDPEVFAKVQFSSVGPVKWRNCMKFGTRSTFRHGEVTYGDHSPCPCWTALDIAAPRHFEAR